jgi:hypothetical protein
MIQKVEDVAITTKWWVSTEDNLIRDPKRFVYPLG